MGRILVIGILVSIGALELSALSQAAQTAKPTFEVATIKLNKDTGPGIRGGNCRGTDSPTPPPPPPAPPGGRGAAPQAAGRGAAPGPALVGPPQIPVGRCVFTRMTLTTLIFNAYQPGGRGVPVNQSVVGAPSWASTETYDVNAKAEDPTTTLDQLRQMMQSLLEDRFKLKTHVETREVPGFALVVARGGTKLKESDGTEQRPGSMMMQVQANPGGTGPVATLMGQKVGIAQLTNMISGQVGRPIEDKTGLNGSYTFTMTFTPDLTNLGPGGPGAPAAPSTTAAASDPGSSLITTLQEELGLRLESEKVSIKVLVIDSAERPTDDGGRRF